MFQTTDLLQPLRDWGISISREQVFRLVTQTPQRLNIELLTALCDVLATNPSELLRLQAAAVSVVRTGTDRGVQPVDGLMPVRARIKPAPEN